jgi:hypothetical protein
MTTTTIVMLVIWNGLLLAALIVVIRKRNRLARWITGADYARRECWDASDDASWEAFLAEHPELRSHSRS